jgi:hypothetical protein
MERIPLCCCGGVSSGVGKVKEAERKNFKPNISKFTSEVRRGHVPVHEVEFSEERQKLR